LVRARACVDPRINPSIDPSIHRSIDPSIHPGYMCPAETPEGQAVGLVKNLALMCEVSTKSPPAPVIDCLDEFGLERFTDISASDLADRRVTKVNGQSGRTH
jgi:DNA-directed RNA polymerase II subunit RPB2